MSDTCPCCGSPVRVHTSSDGTSSYEPVVVVARCPRCGTHVPTPGEAGEANTLDKARKALKAIEPHHYAIADEAHDRPCPGCIAREALAALPPKAEPVCGRASGVRCTVPLCPYPHCDAFLPAHFPPGFEWSEEEGRPVYKGPPPPEFARLAALERVAKACERLATATYGLLGATEGLVYKGQQTATPTFHAATAEADEAANAARDALDDLDGKQR